MMRRPEILEADALRQQRMRADHDVDLAGLQLLARLRQLLRRHEPRRARDLHREAVEALGEGLVMLAREQRRRHDDGHLFALHHREEGGPQRHFGLAEADIAADEPVHRLALGEVVGDGLDARKLVVGLLVGEARDELIIGALGRGEDGRRLRLARGRDLDQFLRHLADALLHARLAALPGGAAELVEVRARLVGAVARQKLHVLDGQEQLVAALIFEFDAIVGRARRVDGLEADEAADAVVGVHHEVARREARRLDEHIARLLGLAAADEPVAEDVLLGDDGEVRRLEAAFETEQREVHRGFIGLARVGDGGDLLDARSAMRPDHGAEPLARAIRPAGDQRAFSETLKHADMLDHGGDELVRGFGALDGEAAALLALEVDLAPARLRLRERLELPQLMAGKPLPPFLAREIERVRRQRLIGRRAEGSLLQPFFSRVVMVGDGLQPPRLGVLRQMVERDDGVRQVIEQRVHALVEQRQPMLLAGIPAARRNRFIKRVVALGGAEQLDIALAEALDGRIARRRLADGQKRDLLARGLGSLRHRIELADAFERVAEKVEPDGPRMPRREQIENAAAHRVFAGLHHRAGPVKARGFEPLAHLIHADLGAGRQPRRRLPDPVERRHALEDGVDRGQHDDRGLAALRMGEPRQRGDAAGLDVAVGRDAVVRHAIPGRKRHDLRARREKFELAAKRLEPLAVARDMQHGLLERRIGGKPPRNRRQEESVVALRHAGRHDGALPAREPVESGRRARLALRGCFLVECAGFARHAGYALTAQLIPPRTAHFASP